MGVRGPFAQLLALRTRLEAASAGEVLQALDADLRTVALRLTFRSFETRTSPRGIPWAPAKGGYRGGLVLSGALRQALRIEDRPAGFAITDRVSDGKGRLYGGTHQYGRTIRAKGDARAYLLDQHGNFATKMRAGKARRIGIGWARQEGAKPLHWRTPDGKWHSAWKVRIRSRAIVPPGGELPPAWEEEFEKAARAILWRTLMSPGA